MSSMAPHRLLLPLPQQHQDKLYFEQLELLDFEADEERHFVFQGQCMVLGDSGVGKTSLIKSLTGKEFDPKQIKTQGIDKSLVDQTWRNFNMKELVLGDLWKFLRSGDAEVFLIRTGEETSNVVRVQKNCMWISSSMMDMLLLCLSLVNLLSLALREIQVHELLMCVPTVLTVLMTMDLIRPFIFLGTCFFSKSTRFIFATFTLIIRFRGLLVGSYLALGLCYWDKTYANFLSIRSTLIFLAIITVFALIALFLFIGPSFHHSLSLCRERIIRNRLSMKFLCFYRLSLSILIGLFCGFLAVTLTTFSFKSAVLSFYCFVMKSQLPRHFLRLLVYECDSWPFYGLLDKCGVLLMSAVIDFYHFKLAWTLSSYYFIILFPLFVCEAIYEELFSLHSIVRGNFGCPNKLITFMTGMASGIDSKKLRNAMNEKFSSLKLEILDFAGDKEYYAYHHTFLRSHALYLIVFNLAVFAQKDFKDLTTRIQRLQFWIESVCSHVPPETPIFLVGTHRGTSDTKHLSIIDTHLRRSLWSSYNEGLVVNDAQGLVFFPVENSDGQKDFGVHCLQTKIIDVAEKCKETIGCDIPLAWVRIQDAIISHKENKGAKFCLTREEFVEVFGNFTLLTVHVRTKNILKYFHEKGLVIYLDRNQDLDLSNWVLLKPEMLVDVIIQLVTPSPQITQERGFKHDWNLLHRKGLLTNSLLKNILSKVHVKENVEAMTAFLEEYDLICPLAYRKVKMCKAGEDNKQPTHFVPSLLPMASERDTPIWHDDDTDKKCYVFFTKFLPEPLFHHLLSRAHKLSKVEFPNGHTVLFRDAGKFWLSAWQPYSLKLIKEVKVIEVTVRCR